MEAFAAAGVPVAAPIAQPREIDGQIYLLMPWLPGRVLRHPPVSDGEFRRLGMLLAEHHAQTAGIAVPAQRPGVEMNATGAAPEIGGVQRRAELLAELAKVDAAMAGRFQAAAEQLQARDMPTLLADCPHRIVQSDFSSWNVRVAGGKLVGLLDFELAHVDVRAADIAAARRGWHDPVVAGYLSHTPLSDAELTALDGLWLGGILVGIWRVLESRIAEGSDLTYGLHWHVEQLDKTRPYRR